MDRDVFTIDAGAMERLKEIFLERVPDFGDFRDRAGTYWASERKYTEDIARLCRSMLTPEVLESPEDEAAAERVIRTTLQFLSRRIPEWNGSQNLLGWRYFDFLRQAEGDERTRFASAFADLLIGAGETPDRVQRFTDAMWPIWQRTEGGNPYALSRNFPTVFLMLFEPKSDIAVRADIFGTAAKLLTTDWVLRYRPFGAEDYRRVLTFSAAIHDSLEEWAWRPRDLIDVHSFLWIVMRPEQQEGSGILTENVEPSFASGREADVESLGPQQESN
jgi:hypothetical protein